MSRETVTTGGEPTKGNRTLSERHMRPKVVAYKFDNAVMKIVPAFVQRAWMDPAHASFAHRCLPLRMANTDGWFLLNPYRITVVWNGGLLPEDLAITREPEFENIGAAYSHFGHGIVTWGIPYLFRTPPGYNLQVRGPANWCKEGVVPLEALVETDWAVAPFTMNWKLNSPGNAVVFEKDEPICMIAPAKRGLLEEFDPQIRDIHALPELQREFECWRDTRKNLNDALRTGTATKKSQGHYYAGIKPTGAVGSDEHQSIIGLPPFRAT